MHVNGYPFIPTLQKHVPDQVQVGAMKVLDNICAQLHCNAYASRIVHPMARLLVSNTNATMIAFTLNIMCNLGKRGHILLFCHPSLL